MAEAPALDFDGLRPPSPFLTSDHAAWRATVRRFIESEITPSLSAWEKAGTFPDALYRKAAAAGVLGMGRASRRLRIWRS